MKVVDELQEFRACSGIEAGNRLIKHEHTGAHGEYAGKSATALLTSGEFEGAFLRNLLGIEAYELEGFVYAFGSFLGG